MGYGERIRDRRCALGMNQAELAEKIGVSRNTVAGWETGHSRPDLATLPKLCATLKMTLNAFFGVERKRSAEERSVLELFFSLEEGDRESMIWQMEALRDRRAEQRRMEGARAGEPAQISGTERIRAARDAKPVLSLPRTKELFVSDLGAAAGFGTPLGEAQGERMTVLEDAETRRADEIITVCGRSMEPTYLDGDMVLVQHTKELREGEIGIFLVDGDGYIKEYRKDGLHSHNPEFRTMTFHEEQTVRCVGRVIGKLREEQIPDSDQLNMIEEAIRNGNEDRH